MANLSLFPTEILCEIFRHLSRASLESASLTNRAFRTICEPLLLHTLHLAYPATYLPLTNTYQFLLQTVIASPQKAKHIKCLYVGRGICRGECRTAVENSSQDAARLEKIAEDLQFAKDHPLLKTLRESAVYSRPLLGAEMSGALLLFLLYYLPALESVHWDQDYCELQKAVEWSIQAPPNGKGPAALQKAIRCARIGEFELRDHDYFLTHSLQLAISWFFLSGLQTLQLENITDENVSVRLPSLIDQPVTDRLSTVKHLLIKECSLGKQNLETLLRLPKALESFVYEPESSYPSVNDIGSSVFHQRNSLKILGLYPYRDTVAHYRLSLRGAYPYSTRDFTLGSLSAFPALETLYVPMWALAEMILQERPAGTPIPDLASFLPPNLKDFATSEPELLPRSDSLISADPKFALTQLTGIVQKLRKLERLCLYYFTSRSLWRQEEFRGRLDSVCSSASVKFECKEMLMFFDWWPEEGGTAESARVFSSEELRERVLGTC